MKVKKDKIGGEKEEDERMMRRRRSEERCKAKREITEGRMLKAAGDEKQRKRGMPNYNPSVASLDLVPSPFITPSPLPQTSCLFFRMILVLMGFLRHPAATSDALTFSENRP